MKKDENTGLYTLTFSNVEFASAGTIFYKVVMNHSWDTNWGFNGNNADFVINGACTSDVTFTFNPTEVLENGFNLSCTVSGNPTGINNIAAETLKTAVIYNINGQRVSQPSRGLYIMNGRKVAIK